MCLKIVSEGFLSEVRARGLRLVSHADHRVQLNALPHIVAGHTYGELANVLKFGAARLLTEKYPILCVKHLVFSQVNPATNCVSSCSIKDHI